MKVAIAGKVGAVYTLDPEAVSTIFAGGAQECTACAEHKRYCVAPALQYLDPKKPVKVYRNSVEIHSGFCIEHFGGCVVFQEAQSAQDAITILAYYFNPDDIKQSGGCFNWSLTIEVDEADVTTYKTAQDSNGWKSFMPLLEGWSASAEAFWGDNSFFESLGKTIIVKLFIEAGAAQDYFGGYAVVTSNDIETPVDGIVEETIDFRGTGLLHVGI